MRNTIPIFKLAGLVAVLFLFSANCAIAQSYSNIQPITNSNLACANLEDDSKTLVRFFPDSEEIRGAPRFKRVLRRLRVRIGRLQERRRAALQNGQHRRAGKIRERIVRVRAIRKAVRECRNDTYVPPVDDNPDSNALRLDLTEVLGVISTEDPVTLSGVNTLSTQRRFMGFNADGSLKDILDSGELPAIQAFTVLDGYLYLIFVSPVSLSKGEEECGFARFAVGNVKVGECIEYGYANIWTSNDPTDNVFYSFVQADGENIYYARDEGSYRVLIRRNDEGEKLALTDENIYTNDFVVMKNGSLIVSGYTVSTQTNWIRRVNPNGGIKNLPGGIDRYRLFPDGKVYLGSENPQGIVVFNPDSDELEAAPWLAFDELNPTHSRTDLCAGGAADHAFCVSGAKIFTQTHVAYDNRVYAHGGFTHNSAPIKLFPEVELLTTEVDQLRRSCIVSNELVLVGLDQAEDNLMTAFDIDDNSERVLMDPEELNIEIYHLQCVASGQAIFEGLNFANNTHVLGSVDLESGEIKLSPVGSRVLGIRAF